MSASMPSLLTAVTAGVAAGFAVAVPLGPMGLLLVDVASRRGSRHGIAAAAGIAAVDLAYAAVAVGLAAAAAAAVGPAAVPMRWLASVVLIALGLRGVWTAGRARSGDATRTVRGGPLRTGAGFLLLTAVNPGTLLHAAIIVVALSDRLPSLAARTLFVVALGVASLTWQLGLVAVGLALGRVPRPGVQQALRTLGNAVILALGALLAVGA